MIKRIIEAISYKHENRYENMNKLSELFEDLMYNAKEKDIDTYTKVKHELEHMAYHLSYEDAKTSVDKMQRKDGSVGEKFTKAETDQFAIDYKIHEYATESNMHFKCAEWYWSMNMAYADYYSSERACEYYVNIAKDFMFDKDGGNHKVSKYIMYISNAE